MILHKNNHNLFINQKKCVSLSKIFHMRFIDWGETDYQTAWQWQECLFNEKIAQKQNNLLPEQDFILCSHPHVYTLGKHAHDSNMLVSDDFLQEIGAKMYHIDRGGDITYHGPGQIVGYPILDLEQLGIGLKEYIFRIEEIIIRLIADYGLKGERIVGATGVWLRNPDRKICAIGVRASRYVTMHGFALNVNTDLRYFTYINPCGFIDKGVTSLAKELGHPVDENEVKQKIYTLCSQILTSNS